MYIFCALVLVLLTFCFLNYCLKLIACSYLLALMSSFEMYVPCQELIYQ